MYTPDYLAKRAKKEGYFARSVYKLQEIHKKYLPLEKFSHVLDLGAAPGSWTQYLLKTLSPSSSIVAIDKKPLTAFQSTQPMHSTMQSAELSTSQSKRSTMQSSSQVMRFAKQSAPAKQCTPAKQKTLQNIQTARGIKLLVLQGDFTEKETLDQLVAMGPYDVILSDAAPDTSGNRLLDTSRSEEIVRSVFSIAKQCLKDDHYLLAKFFQGEGSKVLLDDLQTYFAHVRRYKPRSVRSASFEEFIICN